MKPVADITGGNVLRIPAIQSPNYVAGVSGWTINQDGTAQFNSATFIGSITIVNGNQLLIYNTAAPAAGSIVMALSPLAGSDVAGNTWGPGFTLFDGTTGATMVNFGANTGYLFANPDNTVGIDLTIRNVPIFVESSVTADPSTIKGVHGAVYSTTETLEIFASTASVATDTHQSQIVAKFTESNALDAADVRFDYQSTLGTTTLFKLTNNTARVPVAFFVDGKTTLGDQMTINSSDTAGAIFIFQNVNTSGNPATVSVQETASTSSSFSTFVSGDAHSRWVLSASGRQRFGDGTNALDTTLERTAAGILAVTLGSFAVTTAGQGYQVKEGSNAKMGTATLAAGTVVVSTTAVTATSRIFLTAQTSGAAPGALRVSARTAGTSFTITSTSATDTSVVAWLIIDPA